MAYQHYRSQFGDTTFTKVFVGGLAWETQTGEMRRYFEHFGEILEAVIIIDKNTGRSKGYGFVTFRDPDSARRSCINPNPVIDGRRTNCNIASFGRPPVPPPRGPSQGGNPYQGGAPLGARTYNRAAAPLPPPPPPPPVLYPPYGYTTFTPDYGYPQAFYNPHLQSQFYNQMYGTLSSTIGTSDYYGYALPAASMGTLSVSQPLRVQGPTHIYYPRRHIEGSFTTFPLAAPMRHSVPSSTDSLITQQTSGTRGGGAAGSESLDTREESS